MDHLITYDKAKWHWGGDYPDDLDESHSFIHSGFFLGWLIDRDLLNPDFVEDWGGEDSALELFKARELSAPKLFERWDGVLDSDMLNVEANAFAQSYFDFEKGDYLDDYERLLTMDLPSMYHVEDTWENYRLIKTRIDERYEEWIAEPRKKRWKFWR